MKVFLKSWRVLLLPLIVSLTGCVATEQYLRPETSAGTYIHWQPQCPGPKNFVEFRTPAEWIVFLVGAELPNRLRPGTRLVAFFDFQALRPEPPRTSWSFFPSEEEKQERQQLIAKRKGHKIEIAWTGPFVTTVLPDGTREQVLLPLFERPFLANEMPRQYDSYWKGAVVSPNRLDSFTIIFPDMLFDGQKVPIPPVKFLLDQDTYLSTINC